MRKSSFLLLATGLVLTLPLEAQTTTGTVRGEVTDTGGAPLPGVTVTLIGEQGVERVVATGENGAYLIPSVQPGTYAVDVQLEGMGQQRAEEVRVNIGGTMTVDFQLGGDRVAEQITITAETPLLDLTGSDVGTNYTSEFVEDLPTHRNFWDLVSVAPGMSQATEDSTSQTALGSSITSNSWNVDGLDVTGPETGNAWWYVNPDIIEEIQVLTIGAPAEFGNMTGAAINVVTKSGGNEYEGSLNSYFQLDELTDEGAEINGIPYSRDKFEDLTLSFGGPIKRDRAWFFVAGQYSRDAFAVPGVEPQFAPETAYDRYDGKLDVSITPRTQLDAKYHYEDYDIAETGSAFIAPEATGSEFGDNPAAGAGISHTITDRTLIEAHYAGWWGDDFWRSQTGSTESTFIDFTPPGGGPAVQTGNIAFPYDYELYRHQGDVKLSHFAQDFLHGDHDFRFGVQYSYGSADTITFPAGNGYYYAYDYDYYGTIYPYYYLYTWTPFHYGNKQRSTSAFADDSWRVNERLTLNVGLRYDIHEGWIPDYPRLDENKSETGETIPGRDDVIDWKVLSPRFGFAYVLGADERTVLRGSAGIYFDGNVGGNWNYPPPQTPPLFTFLCDGPPPTTCDFSEPYDVDIIADVGVDPGLDPPRAEQYALGAERQIGDSMAAGVQLVYKETRDLIGWEILGDGIYDIVDFTDPVTGEVIQLVSFCDEGCAPTIRKGNRPGAGSLAPDEEYHQDYRAAIFTFERRHREGWSLLGSYTWSRSEGLLPRPDLQTQGAPFYGSLNGSDPNEWLRADQLLQNDREHMVRVQGNFELPASFLATVALNWQSGRPFARLARIPGSLLEQGSQTIVIEPASDDRRLPSVTLLDVGIGRRWSLGGDVQLKTDLQVLNLLNEDENQFWEDLTLGPGEVLVPTDFVYPRRGVVRIGLEF